MILSTSIKFVQLDRFPLFLLQVLQVISFRWALIKTVIIYENNLQQVYNDFIP